MAVRRRRIVQVIVVIGALLFFSQECSASEKNHKYANSEAVIVWANKVGPYWNTNESYKYFSLPFCIGTNVEQKKKEISALGEALQGSDFQVSGYNMHFKVANAGTELCSVELDVEQAEAFIRAVSNHYWFQFYLDDLPIWGMVGEMDSEGNFFVFSHRKFMIEYNGNRIISVNVTMLNPVQISPMKTLHFSYSTIWTPTNLPFEQRFSKYLDYNFFEHQIHWFSIFNSFMMVIFLTGLVSMILLRTLRNDYARYSRDENDLLEELDQDLADDSGWKQVHGDVFRPPRRLTLFSALIGSGYQLLACTFVLILWALMGKLYMGRGDVVQTLLLCYFVCSFVAGYTSGAFYERCQGVRWIRTMLLTMTLCPLVVAMLILSFNFVAVYYGSLAAIPVQSMFMVVMLFLLVQCPLTLVGFLLGKNISGKPNRPCRVNPVSRIIPDKRWFLKPVFGFFSGGILPFGSIFIEMYFVYTAFWNYKFYFVYGFMLFVFIILILVTVCVSVVLTYFQLNAEEYRWAWMSFASSSSTAVYLFIYSVYYFVAKTRMSGMFQTLYYFTYTTLMCLAVGLITGTAGFAGTSIFVRWIYRNVKVD